MLFTRRILTIAALTVLGPCFVSCASDTERRTAEIGVEETEPGNAEIEHFVSRRLHAVMWYETVLEAFLNPFRPLNETPAPDDECISLGESEGSIEKGFTWDIHLDFCEDLNGVSRLISGTLTYTGEEYDFLNFRGTYEGTFDIVWLPDPDGGRAEEAARLNETANQIIVRGGWALDSSLLGNLEAVVNWSAGSLEVVDPVVVSF